MLASMLSALVLLLCLETAQAEPLCIFNWSSPTVNEFTEVTVIFSPLFRDEVAFTDFYVEFPLSYGLPVITSEEMSTVVSTSVAPTKIQNDEVSDNTGIFNRETDFSTRNTADWFQIQITNLKAANPSRSDANLQYIFGFSLKGAAFEQSIDATTIQCRTQDNFFPSSPVDRDTALGSSGQVFFSIGTEETEVEVQMDVSSTSMTASASSTTTGVSSTLTLGYTTSQQFLPNTWVYLTIPKSNVDYNTGNNDGFATSFVDTGNMNLAEFSIGGTALSIDIAKTFYAKGAGYDPDVWSFTFSAGVSISLTGQAIEIVVPIINPPYTTEILDTWNIILKTEQGTSGAGTDLPKEYADYEVAIDPPLDAGVVASTKRDTTQGNSAVITGNLDGIGVRDSTYEFEFRNNNPIPVEGLIIITVPIGVTIPDGSVVGFSYACSQGCDTDSPGTLSYSDVDRELTITGAFTTYLEGGVDIVRFTITGWQNPEDSQTYDFGVETCFKGTATCTSCCGIETFTGGFQIQAKEGNCQVQSVYVTDGDTRIYAQAQSMTFQMWCNHAVETDYGIRIVFPEEYSLIDRSSCSFTGYATRYYCQILAETNTLEVRQFTDDIIEAQDIIIFTIDSIINPGTFDATGAILVSTIDEYSSVVDSGDFTLDAGYFTTGNVTTFTVTPQDIGVGQYPVKYDFNVVPNGEISRYGYLEIELPDSIEIIDENDFESNCGEDVYAFTNTVISCVVTNGGRTIQVKDGFLYSGSNNFTDSDGLYRPPDLQFTLDGFQNPRESGQTGTWNVTVYNEKEKPIYYWQTSDAPTIYVSGVAQPSYLELILENKQNGALSWIEFLVTTTGGLSEQDKIIVKLPYGWQFSADSQVIGRSNNLGNVMPQVSVSVDQRQLEVSIDEIIAGRSLAVEGFNEDFLDGGRHLQDQIESGLSYQFRITNMKNFNSFRPSDSSIEYYVYSQAGVLFEEQTTGMFLSNDVMGDLASSNNGIIPGSFKTDFEANYTLTVEMQNFEKNMVFVLYLPDEIDFGDEDPFCESLSGIEQDSLKCEADRTKKTLRFSNAMQYAQANPGQMRILIDPLKNPDENIITSSFAITSETFDGYPIDKISTDITINFYCEYPCAECPQGSPQSCELCYQTSVERYFYSNKCLSECPEFMVETEDLTCTNCASPCVTCDGSPDYCTLCIDGYYVVEDGKCREEITWYFPFIGMALAFFILISLSECVTKGKSNFKESLIAFWSIPEVLSWGCLIWFMWNRIGQSEATGLAALAAMCYVCINLVHAIFHPRYMVPNTLYSYKVLLTDYKCGTFIARSLSYLISFKFSLILVSYFFGSNRLKGDYSAMNWKQFNRFSMAFIFLPYALMMGSCSYFIMTDGFWSYPGFVAAEVVVLSTFIAMLLAIDAFSAIKCKTVGKRKTNKAIRVATGADYESDEDEMNLKKQVARAVKTTHRKQQDDFGVGDSEDYGSEVDSVKELTKSKRPKKLTRNQPGDYTPGADRSERSERSERSDYDQYDESDDMTKGGGDTHRGGTKRPRNLRLDSEQSHRSFGSRNSKMSVQTAIMNEEARKQIAMLEELAHQMREEKRQLQMDKERIEREKTTLQEERGRTQHHLDAYMDDYQRQTTALSNQVQSMERQKIDLVQQVEERLEEGNRANIILAQKVTAASNAKTIQANNQIRKQFRDFEGEMEDYEPVEEENSDDAESSIAEVVDAAQLPVLPACGQIDYYRHIEGDDQHWMQQITPRAGGDSMLGQHDMEDDMELQMEKNATAHYEIASIPPSRYDDQMENGAVEAEFQEMTSQVEANQSEEFQQRSDAEMEVNSEVEEKELVEQEFFEPERAIFSQLQDREFLETKAEFFTNDVQPVFEELPRVPTRHGVEQSFFSNIVPKVGEGDKTDELIGSSLHFFKQEAPTFGEVLEDGDMQREATAQQFFNPLEKAVEGQADDAARSGIATPMEYMERSDRVYGRDVDDPNELKAPTEYGFQQVEAPVVKDVVSNMGRSYKGSELVYQEKDDAYIGKDVDDDRERQGTEQQFFQREEAMYSQDKSQNNKNATQAQFFKHDEAVRGDVSSGDRSKMLTEQNYFNNDEPQLGRPDSYDRYKSEVPVEYKNKSDLGGASEQRRAAGLATPHNDRVAAPMEYMNKSEAEFGRQSSIKEKDRSQHKYFEQEQNPEFGRGDQFVRQVEHEQEYNPPAVEDSSGNSESSEGGIADHQPFTSGVIPQRRESQQQNQRGPAGPSHAPDDPNVQQVRQQLHGNPNAQQYEADQNNLQRDMPDAQHMISPNKPRGASLKEAPGQNLASMIGEKLGQEVRRQAKTILYSDKSETSVEDLMDDTPSNYNIQNGRFEGKSLGLKALLLHARNYQNNTIDGILSGKPEALLNLGNQADQQNRSPPQMRPGQGMLSPGMVGVQKGIIGSQKDERNFVNNLYQTGDSMGQPNQWKAGGPVNGQRVPVIGEESDGGQVRNTRNQVRTNKQYQEDPRNARGGQANRGRVPQGGLTGARSPNVQQPGGPRGPSKNNYFGGAT